MRTIYIADDGKEFDNEFECKHYILTKNADETCILFGGAYGFWTN